MILITLESNVKMLPFDDAAFWAGKIKWWSRRWRGLECNESIDGWEAKEVAALQRIRHHLSRDESTFNLKQVCDQRNLEDSFIGIIVGRLGGLTLLQDRAFLDLFAVRSVIAFNWRISKYISMCFTSPFIWIFHEMRSWILRKSACFVVLLRCVSMLDQPDVKRAAGHDLRLLPSSLVCLPLFFTISQFSDGWRDPMLPPSPISKLIQSSLATLLSW